MAVPSRNQSPSSNLTTFKMPAMTSSPASNGELIQVLDRLADQFGAANKKLDTVRLSRLVLTSFSNNPQLMECTYFSIIGSIMAAAQLDLEFVLGEAYLVPYKDRIKKITTCTFVPGWQGLVKLVNRSGMATIQSRLVYEGDEFDYNLGTNQFIQHKAIGDEIAGKMLYAYAVGTIAGSAHPLVEVWPISKIWSHRDRYNRQGDKHYSFKFPDAYARKIPLLQLVRTMPKSVIDMRVTPQVIDGSKVSASMIIDDDAPLLESGNQSFSPESESTTPATKTKKQWMREIEQDPSNAIDIAEEAGGDKNLSEDDKNEIKKLASSVFDNYTQNSNV